MITLLSMPDDRDGKGDRMQFEARRDSLGRAALTFVSIAKGRSLAGVGSFATLCAALFAFCNTGDCQVLENPYAARRATETDSPLEVKRSEHQGTRSVEARLPSQTGDYDWSTNGEWLCVLRYDPAEVVRLHVPTFTVKQRLDLRSDPEQLAGTTNFICMARCKNGLALLGTRHAFLGPATVHVDVRGEVVVIVDPDTLNVVKVFSVPASSAMAACRETRFLYLASSGDERVVRVVDTDTGRVVSTCGMALPSGNEDLHHRSFTRVKLSSNLFARGHMTPDGKNLYFSSQRHTWRFNVDGQEIQEAEVLTSSPMEDHASVFVSDCSDRIGLAMGSGVAIVAAQNLPEKKCFVGARAPVAFDPQTEYYWAPASPRSLVAYNEKGKPFTKISYDNPKTGRHILISPNGGEALVFIESRLYHVELTSIPFNSAKGHDWLTRLRPTTHENEFPKRRYPWTCPLAYRRVFAIERGEIPAVSLAWSADGKYLFALSNHGVLRRFVAPDFSRYTQLQFPDFQCKSTGPRRPSPAFGLGMVPCGDALAVGLDGPSRCVAVVDPDSMIVSRVILPGEFLRLLPSAGSDVLFGVSSLGIGSLNHPDNKAFTLPDVWTGAVAGKKHLFAVAHGKLTRYSIGAEGLVKGFQDDRQAPGYPVAGPGGNWIGCFVRQPSHVTGHYTIRDAESLDERAAVSTRALEFHGFSVDRGWLIGSNAHAQSHSRKLTLLGFDGDAQEFADPRTNENDPIAVDPLGRGFAIGYRHNSPGILWAEEE